MNKLLIAVIALCCTLASAQTAAPAAPPMRLRATIEKIEGSSMTVKERSGEVITLALADNLNVSEVFPIPFTAIQPGSFIGTAAMPRADGTLDADGRRQGHRDGRAARRGAHRHPRACRARRVRAAAVTR